MVRAGLMWEVQPCVARGADASTGWASVAQILRYCSEVRGGGEILTKQFAKDRMRGAARCAATLRYFKMNFCCPFRSKPTPLM
eukprot:scaffold78288_cov63-Phaeocystis_antarctica.AAC.1